MTTDQKEEQGAALCLLIASAMLLVIGDSQNDFEAAKALVKQLSKATK